MKLVIRQLMWATLSCPHPPPPRTAGERQRNFKHPGPPLAADGHIRGMRGGREGGVYYPVWVPHLLCSTPGYSHRDNSTRGNTLWVLQGKQGTRVQRREGEGVGGGEEESKLRRPGPSLAAVCWATLSRPTPPPPAAETPFSSLFAMA